MSDKPISSMAYAPVVNSDTTSPESILARDSKKIEAQAKSGDLLNQMNLPTEPGIKYTLPAGSDKLQKMDYAKQKEVKEVAPSMFSLKTMMDQINANLR